MKSHITNVKELSSANFIEWYKSLDDDFQEALIGFLNDEKEQLMKQVIRRKKLNKIYE